jgi:hypothetical protein
LLEDEIISRYFYESGAIAWTLKKDEQVLRALEVLNNKTEYASILSGKKAPVMITGKPVKEASLKNQIDPISIRGNRHQISPSSRQAASL